MMECKQEYCYCTSIWSEFYCSSFELINYNPQLFNSFYFKCLCHELLIIYLGSEFIKQRSMKSLNSMNFN